MQTPTQAVINGWSRTDPTPLATRVAAMEAERDELEARVAVLEQSRAAMIYRISQRPGFWPRGTTPGRARRLRAIASLHISPTVATDARKIALAYDVSERTAQRDLRVLRECGILIDA